MGDKDYLDMVRDETESRKWRGRRANRRWKPWKYMEESGMATYLGIIFLYVFVLGACTGVFQVAWNYVVPAVFSLPPITFLQAFALMFICSVIFKSSSS